MMSFAIFDTGMDCLMILAIGLLITTLVIRWELSKRTSQKYDDTLETFAILCLTFFAIGLWARLGSMTIQALRADFRAGIGDMSTSIPFIVWYGLASYALTVLYAEFPTIKWVKRHIEDDRTEQILEVIFILQISAYAFTIITGIATICVRVYILPQGGA